MSAPLAGRRGIRAVAGVGRPAGLTHPNEPVGLTLHTYRECNALDEDGWTDSDGNHSLGGPSATHSIVSDGVGGFALRVNLPEGMSGDGSSSAMAQSDAPNFAATEYIYLDYVITYDANYWGQPGSGVNKMLYVGGQGPALILDAQGIGLADLVLRLASQSGETVNFDWDEASGGVPNEVSVTQADATLERGVKNRITLLITVNTPGVANGRYDAWVNGVKTHQYSNRNIFASGQNLNAHRLHVNPIYGGQYSLPEYEFPTPAEDVPYDMGFQYDYFYLSCS